MKVFSNEIIQMLSERVKKCRIDYPMTQKQLAEKSGVSVRSIQMFENGNDMQLSNFIKIVNALDLAENFELIIPDVSMRPSQYLEESVSRKRARVKKNAEKSKFVWGDDK